MEEYPNSNGNAPPAPGNASPRRSSDVLSDRLAQVRLLAGQTERQRELSAARNLGLRDQIEALRKHMEQRFEESLAQRDPPLPAGGGDALHRELDALRTRAAADLDEMRQQLLTAEQAITPSREVELEAELQAERQQVSLLRKTLQEKDRALEDLAAQCQCLEDVLEDRNREMDHLTQKIELSRTGSPPPDPAPLAVPMGPQADDRDALYAIRDPDSGEILDVTHLTYLPRRHPPWRLIGMSVGGLLALGLTSLLAVFLLARQPGPALILPTDAQAPEAALVSPASPRPEGGDVESSPVPETGAAMPSPAIAEVPPTVTAVGPAGPRMLRDRLSSGGEGPLMVQLPAGRFVMGGKPGLAGPEEQPARERVLGAFYIGRYEITFDEYARFARASGQPLPDDAGFGRGQRPVINVSWEDAQDYVRWLSSETRQRYHLSSEAEWEYAARGGSRTRYWWGFAPQAGRAVCFACGTRWVNRSTAPVGSLKANAFGLYDTSGNVMEWVQDCYHKDYQGAPSDGSPWLGGDCGQHMVRGGAFNKPASSARSNARYQLPTNARLNMLGFRVVRD